MCERADTTRDLKRAAEALTRACECALGVIGADFNKIYPPAVDLPPSIIDLLGQLDATARGASQ